MTSLTVSSAPTFVAMTTKTLNAAHAKGMRAGNVDDAKASLDTVAGCAKEAVAGVQVMSYQLQAMTSDREAQSATAKRVAAEAKLKAIKRASIAGDMVADEKAYLNNRRVTSPNALKETGAMHKPRKPDAEPKTPRMKGNADIPYAEMEKMLEMLNEGERFLMEQRVYCAIGHTCKATGNAALIKFVNKVMTKRHKKQSGLDDIKEEIASEQTKDLEAYELVHGDDPKKEKLTKHALAFTKSEQAYARAAQLMLTEYFACMVA